MARALKMFQNGTGRLGLSLVSSLLPILHLDMVYCKFLLYVSVAIDPFSWEQTSAI